MPAACGHSWAELRPYAEERIIDGKSLRVLGLRGLLLTKEGMRDKDRADVAAEAAAETGEVTR